MCSRIFLYFFLIPLSISFSVAAGENMQLDTTIIKGDKESPAILYIVSWKEIRHHGDEYQGLIIDDLRGNILAPTLPGRELLTRQ